MEECQFCSKCYTRRSRLKIHYQDTHPNGYECLIRPWDAANIAAEHGLVQCTCGLYIPMRELQTHVDAKRCPPVPIIGSLDASEGGNRIERGNTDFGVSISANILASPSPGSIQDLGIHDSLAEVEDGISVRSRHYDSPGEVEDGDSPGEVEDADSPGEVEDGDSPGEVEDGMSVSDDENMYPASYTNSEIVIPSRDWMLDRDDTECWTGHPLCGEVYLGGWSQWSKHTDQTNQKMHLPFRVLTVRMGSSGVQEALLYPVLSYYSGKDAQEWHGWGVYDARSTQGFPGRPYNDKGYRIAIINLPLSNLRSHAKLGHETVNQMKQDRCCDCNEQFIQGTNFDSSSVFCNGLGSFHGIISPCFRGRGCSVCAAKPESWLRNVPGVEPSDLSQKAVFLCPSCRALASSYGELFEPDDQRHPTAITGVVSPFDRPGFLFQSNYNAPAAAAEFQAQRSVSVSEAESSCLTGRSGVAVQTKLLSFCRRHHLSSDATKGLLRTLNDMDDDSLIDLYSRVPRKRETLEKIGGSGLVSRSDTTAKPVSYDCTDLRQNAVIATGAYSNIFSAVESVFNDEKFPRWAWHLEGVTGYIRGAEYAIVDRDGNIEPVTGGEPWESRRLQQLEKYAPEGYTVIYLTVHSDKAKAPSGTLHPLTITVDNLSNEFRSLPEARRTLALLPIPIIRRDERLDETQKKFKCTMTSHSIAQAFVDANDASTPPGVVHSFRGFKFDSIYRIRLYTADYPEQVDIACIISGRCPICPAVEIGQGWEGEEEEEEDSSDDGEGVYAQGSGRCGKYLSLEFSRWGSSASFRRKIPDNESQRTRIAANIFGLKSKVAGQARKEGHRIGAVNHLARLRNLIPSEVGGIPAMLTVDELHTLRSGVEKVMPIQTEKIIHRYMSLSPSFKSREDVMHFLGEMSDLVPSYTDGSRRMLKITGGPLNIPRDAMAAEKWEAAFLQMPYHLLGNKILIEDDEVRLKVIQCYDFFTEAWAYMKAADEAYYTKNELKHVDGLLKNTTKLWIWWQKILESPFPDQLRPFTGSNPANGNLDGKGFNRIKCHLVSHCTQSLEFFGALSSSSARDGERNMIDLKLHDSGTRNNHAHDHNFYVLQTVEASESQRALEQPLPLTTQQGTAFQLQDTFIFREGGAIDTWGKIHGDLRNGEHGPSFPPEITAEHLKSTIWEKVKRVLFHGSSHQTILVGRQVLGHFGNRNSLLRASACVQLSGIAPRFAQLVAFMELKDSSVVIYAVVCEFIHPIDHPEHKRLLLTSRSPQMSLVPVADIKGTVPVVPYFASAGHAPKTYTYTQFIIDVRLIWRLGGLLRIDTKAKVVKRRCPGFDSQSADGKCCGKISKPTRKGELVTCDICGFRFQW